MKGDATEQAQEILSHDIEIEKKKGSSFRGPVFFRRGLFLSLFLAALSINAALWLLVFFFIGTGSERIVIRYNIFFGIDLTGSASQGFLVPITTTVFFCINTLLAIFFAEKQLPFPALFLSVASFLLHVAALIAVSALLLINN